MAYLLTYSDWELHQAAALERSFLICFQVLKSVLVDSALNNHKFDERRIIAFE
jgi:hypothetical protein